MADKLEIRGQTFAIPLQCACGHVCIVTYARWCGACGMAICAKCFPAENKEDVATCKCARCIAENRPLDSGRLGDIAAEMRRERDELFWKTFLEVP